MAALKTQGNNDETKYDMTGSEGNLHEVKGKAFKKEVGKATNDPDRGSLRECGEESRQSAKTDRSC